MWHVLLVEDDPATAQQLTRLLKRKARCVLAKTGQEALQIYQDTRNKGRHFDFVLLDVGIPQPDGFAVLTSIRQDESTQAPPRQDSLIIMITAYKDSLMDKYNMGWDDFLTKPVEGEKLLSHMETLWRDKNNKRTQHPPS